MKINKYIKINLISNIDFIYDCMGNPMQHLKKDIYYGLIYKVEIKSRREQKYYYFRGTLKPGLTCSTPKTLFFIKIKEFNKDLVVSSYMLKTYKYQLIILNI